MLIYYKNDPKASFGFVAANDIDSKTNENHIKQPNKRFRL